VRSGHVREGGSVRVRRSGLVFVLAMAACATEPAADALVVRVRASAEQPLAADAIRYEPADNVLSARLGAEGVLAIERRDRTRALMVHVPEMCPVALPAGPQREPVDARPVIDLGRERAPVGFDTPFTIKVEHGCPERGRGQVQWRQIEGVAVADLAIAREGFELRARTPRFEAAHPEPAPPGIVPFSPRTQGRVVLEALWQGPGSPPIRRTATMRSTSRSTGLSSVAVSQQIMLSGDDWHVQKAAPSGHAQVHASGALGAFTPDAPGSWTLARGDGQTLVLQALWHDKTPYDCGRSGCHSSIAATTLASPMSSALQRHLESPEPVAVGCMLDCHVLGQRGSHDGGFTDVAAQLGFNWLAPTRWDDLPQPLRRLGGVRCTACHGPGVLPEPEGRELVLRSDVCASCHDAPPRYMKVEQWRASAMARSDAAPSTRTGVCASCHTTRGFLERVADRKPRPHAGDAEPIGIACAACHAPHSEHRGARLVRSTSASALCLSCHALAPDQALPLVLSGAPSGALWQGFVSVPAVNGDGWEVLRAGGAHGQVPGGCVGCHGATASGGIDHSFRVDTKTCTSCHVDGARERLTEGTADLERRARALARTLEGACAQPTSEPAHALPAQVMCKEPGQTRALHEVSVLLEDPAAFVHNAALARALLDDAERISATPQ
jgi:predicted CXXCH cytochrome family protein